MKEAGPSDAVLDEIDRAALTRFGEQVWFEICIENDDPRDLGNLALIKLDLIAAGKYAWTCRAERQRDIQRMTESIKRCASEAGCSSREWGRIKRNAELIEHLYGHLTVRLPYTPGGNDYPEEF